MPRRTLTDWIIVALALAFCGYASLIALVFGFDAPSVPGVIQQWWSPVWVSLLALNAALAIVTLVRKGVNHAALLAAAPILAAIAVIVVFGLLSFFP